MLLQTLTTRRKKNALLAQRRFSWEQEQANGKQERAAEVLDISVSPLLGGDPATAGNG